MSAIKPAVPHDERKRLPKMNDEAFCRPNKNKDLKMVFWLEEIYPKPKYELVENGIM